MYSCGPLHMDEQKQDNQLKPTYSSSVPIRDVALRTCQKQWTIGRGGKRGSGISVLIEWHDDTYIYIYSYVVCYIYKERVLNIGDRACDLACMRKTTQSHNTHTHTYTHTHTLRMFLFRMTKIWFYSLDHIWWTDTNPNTRLQIITERLYAIYYIFIKKKYAYRKFII